MRGVGELLSCLFSGAILTATSAALGHARGEICWMHALPPEGPMSVSISLVFFPYPNPFGTFIYSVCWIVWAVGRGHRDVYADRFAFSPFVNFQFPIL